MRLCTWDCWTYANSDLIWYWSILLLRKTQMYNSPASSYPTPSSSLYAALSIFQRLVLLKIGITAAHVASKVASCFSLFMWRFLSWMKFLLNLKDWALSITSSPNLSSLQNILFWHDSWLGFWLKIDFYLLKLSRSSSLDLGQQEEQLGSR